MPTEAELKKKLTPGGGVGCGWHQWGVGGSSGVRMSGVGCGRQRWDASNVSGVRAAAMWCRRQVRQCLRQGPPPRAVKGWNSLATRNNCGGERGSWRWLLH